MKKVVKLAVFFVTVFAIALTFNAESASAKAKKKSFTVTPKSLAKMAKKNHKKNYDKYTKDWLGFNDYFKKLEKSGGGKITIKKGTYNICNSIYVPSNVEIVFENQVVMNKTNKTGKSGIKASGSMWQLCPYSKHSKKNSIGKYNGSKNIKFKGTGKVSFNMNYIDGICIISAHTNHIEISGITFKGMNGNHYIEINGSNNVVVSNCKFLKAKESTLKKYYNKEAINIDLADKATNGLPLSWVKKDKTPCDTIVISDNVFDGMTRGIGTHKYSQDGKGQNIYHKRIVIKNNSFKNIFDNGIFVLNWSGATIANNTFYNIGKSTMAYSSGSHGISGGGIDGINITENTFEKVRRNVIYFIQQQNVGAGSKYKKVTVKITSEQVKAMCSNTVKNCGNDANANYAGYDVLFFRNDGTKTRGNGVGIDLKTKRVYDSKDGLPKDKKKYDAEHPIEKTTSPVTPATTKAEVTTPTEVTTPVEETTTMETTTVEETTAEETTIEETTAEVTTEEETTAEATTVESTTAEEMTNAGEEEGTTVEPGTTTEEMTTVAEEVTKSDTEGMELKLKDPLKNPLKKEAWIALINRQLSK